MFNGLPVVICVIGSLLQNPANISWAPVYHPVQTPYILFSQYFLLLNKAGHWEDTLNYSTAFSLKMNTFKEVNNYVSPSTVN